MAAKYAIEESKVLMRLVANYTIRPNVEAASVAADIVSHVLMIVPGSVNRPWIKEALAEYRQVCLQAHVPAGVMYGILHVLEMAPEPGDGEYLAYATGKWSDELYDRASPMGWLKATYKLYPVDVRLPVPRIAACRRPRGSRKARGGVAQSRN